MRGEGADLTGYGLGDDPLPVRRDPGTISRAELIRLVRPAMLLCSAVEGLSTPPGVTPDIAARLLREPILALRRELEALGAIFPRGGA